MRREVAASRIGRVGDKPGISLDKKFLPVFKSLMTVTYARKVDDASPAKFFMLLLRWRGSVWKEIQFELGFYVCIYWLLTVFNLALFRPNGEAFAVLTRYCSELCQSMCGICAFVIGFYIMQIYNRWWTIYMLIPWPDSICFELGCYYMDTKDERHTQLTIVRYLSLCYVLVFRDISEKIKMRFPSLSSMEGSLVTTEEKHVLEKFQQQEAVNWLPIEWTLLLLKKAYQNQALHDYNFVRLTKSVLDYRERLHSVLQFDIVNLPLAYTQAVHLLVYMHLLLLLLASQKNVGVEKLHVEMALVPFATLIQFVLLLGLLKFAEVMINPLGNDDDDFDINTMIERNFQISYRSVERFQQSKPKKSDIRFTSQLPKPTEQTMIENILRPGNVIRGSAIPEPKKESVRTTTPDVEAQIVLSQKKKSQEITARIQPTQLEQTPREPQKSTMRTKTERKGRVSRSSELQKSKENTSRITPPNPSQNAAPMSSPKSKALKADRLREKLEMLTKIEAKRERMEVDRTQLDDGEEEPEEPSPRQQIPTQRGSLRDPSSRADGTQLDSLKSPRSMSSTQKTQMSVRRAKSANVEKSRQQEAFHSFVMSLKKSAEQSQMKEPKD